MQVAPLGGGGAGGAGMISRGGSVRKSICVDLFCAWLKGFGFTQKWKYRGIFEQQVTKL